MISHVAGTVVVADSLFTATAVVIQPITGYLLARDIGWSLTEGWLLASLGLYIFTGLCWLPVVWIQIRLRHLAQQAARAGAPLNDDYHRLWKIWFVLGFPAFFAVIGIMWLMISRPDISILG